MVLLLMLVLAALTSLLATSNLERTHQRTLLDRALAIRVQVDTALTNALYQGIAYAREQLKIADFDVALRGVYKNVDPNRMKSDYRRSARPLPSSLAGVDSGFWIELFSEGTTMQTAKSNYYLSCRLLISAYVEHPELTILFSQALVETALPILGMPTSDTQVVKVETIPNAKVIATRILN